MKEALPLRKEEQKFHGRNGVIGYHIMCYR